MDPRVRDHAEIVAEHSTEIRPGDDVLVMAPPAAEEFVAALYEEIGARDARPFWSALTGRASRRLARAADPDAFDTPEHAEAAVEASDVIVSVKASTNASEMSDVPSEQMAVRARARQPVTEAAMEKRWCLTQHPTPAAAQLAGMSTDAYESFVYDAVGRDWSEQAAFQQQLVEILDPADEVRVVSGDDTDLRMSVSGADAVNDDGRNNLPGGEVFVSPRPASVEGEVHFDLPVYYRGREVRGARLRFEDGEVVSHSADENEGVLSSLLETDRGARRVGELGVGMNRAIDRFTYNMLFDEKMGDTIHVALGRSVEESLPSPDGNDSAVHVDMLVDVGEDSRIEVDGEVVQRDGTFVFEE